ncbi:MAG: histidine--tRNA ligase [Thermodesulfobacteria bacterium]|nr:histidine--tRNA ligase [Thermodesulfobacteriota bacterium]
MKIQSVRGFKDWLPEEFAKYRYLIDIADRYLSAGGFKQIKLPILEKTELFIRSIGEVTDIVQKETYSFEDRNKEWLTLRPEATAGICRSIIEHGLHTKPKPLKFYTVGPMFRHERPQKGRLREFYQVDAEYFGELNPYVEAEIIILAKNILEEPFKENGISFEGFKIEVNSLGCSKCRPNYRSALVEFLKEKKQDLCEVCKNRLERNPLRVLDCKVETCKQVVSESPVISDFFCEECKEHFEKLKEILKALGINFEVNPRLVRGLDYYTRTIFEIKGKGLGAQDTVAAGGRYDNLLQELGGPFLPAIGFAIGLERWAIVVFENIPGLAEKLENSVLPDVFLAVLGEENFLEGMKIADKLRRKGLKTEATYEKKGLKGLLKTADKLKAKTALIVGEKELKEKNAILKNMRTGEQKEVKFEDFDNLAEKVLNFINDWKEERNAL